MVPTIPKLAPSSSDDGTTVVVTVVVVTVCCCCCCCCTRGGGTGCCGGCGNATAFAAAVKPAGLGGATTTTDAGALPVRDGMVGGGTCVILTFPVSADDGGGAFAGVGPGGDGKGVDGVGSAVTLIGLGDCGLVPIADDD